MEKTTGLEGLDTKTRKLWEAQIRAALMRETKPGKAGPKACSVCGKPDTRNHKGLTNAHAEASLKAYPSQWKMLTKVLDGKVDFVQRGQFNAQQAFLMDQLLLARMEHEAYEPTTNTANAISNKSLVLGVLAATFKMLGITLPACPKAKDGKTDRPWSVLQQMEILNLELAKLHGVDTDVTVSEHPAEDEPEADKDKTGSDGDKGAEQQGGQGNNEQDATPASVEKPEPTEAEKAKAALVSDGGTLKM